MAPKATVAMVAIESLLEESFKLHTSAFDLPAKQGMCVQRSRMFLPFVYEYVRFSSQSERKRFVGYGC